jgi:hypothetical protein
MRRSCAELAIGSDLFWSSDDVRASTRILKIYISPGSLSQ